VVQFLGGFEMRLPQQQLAFVPVQLCCEPALARSFNNPQSIIQQGLIGHGRASGFDDLGRSPCAYAIIVGRNA
jgi:hypothetical protein